MRVYVDDAIHPFGRMIMCHMFSPDLEALHSMANRIGVARKWFQDPHTMPKVSWPHYDIAKSKRSLAVSLGAVECDKYQMIAMSAIILNKFYGTDRHDPMKWVKAGNQFATHVPLWLAEQGFPQWEYDL